MNQQKEKKMRRKRYIIPMEQRPVEERVTMQDKKETRLFPTPTTLAYQAACEGDEDKFYKFQSGKIPHIHRDVLEIAAKRNDIDCVVWVFNIVKVTIDDCRRAYQIAHDEGSITVYEYFKIYFNLSDLPTEYETDTDDDTDDDVDNAVNDTVNDNITVNNDDDTVDDITIRTESILRRAMEFDGNKPDDIDEAYSRQAENFTRTRNIH